MQPYPDLNLLMSSPPPDVKNESGFFKNAQGDRLFWQTWESVDEDPRALLVIHHGFAGHSNRYHHVASFFARNQYVVLSFDAQGHGQSSGTRGYIRAWEEYVVDLDLAVRLFFERRNKDRSLPRFVLGHSNGGLIALTHALVSPEKASSYILSSPFCGLALAVSPFKISLANILSKILPKLPIVAEFSPEILSHVPEVVEKYASDSLIFSTMPPRTFTEIKKMQDQLYQKADQIEVPLYFLVSGDDLLVDPNVTKQIFDRLSTKERHYEYLEGLYHENLNEEGWQERLIKVLEWLKSRREAI